MSEDAERERGNAAACWKRDRAEYRGVYSGRITKETRRAPQVTRPRKAPERGLS